MGGTHTDGQTEAEISSVLFGSHIEPHNAEKVRLGQRAAVDNFRHGDRYH